MEELDTAQRIRSLRRPYPRIGYLQRAILETGNLVLRSRPAVIDRRYSRTSDDGVVPLSPHDGVVAIPAVDGVAARRRSVLDENDVASGRLNDGVVAATEGNDVAKPRAGDGEVLVTGIGVIERRINRKRSLPGERRLNGHGRAVEVHYDLGLCCGRGGR